MTPRDTPLGTLDGRPVFLRDGYIWCGGECVDDGTEYHTADAARMMLLYWFDDLGRYTPPIELVLEQLLAELEADNPCPDILAMLIADGKRALEVAKLPPLEEESA
jgi:hypothetical protein